MPATVARIAAKGQHAIDSTVLWMKQTVSGPLVELRPEITAQTLDRFLTHAWAVAAGLIESQAHFEDIYGLDNDVGPSSPPATQHGSDRVRGAHMAAARHGHPARQGGHLLFPITDAYEQKRGEDARIAAEGQQAIDPTVFWMKQTISNACGTMALLHALINSDVTFAPESPIEKFIDICKDKTPEERAKILETTPLFANIHADAASTGQTSVPADLDTDLHFTCFVQAPAPPAREQGTPVSPEGMRLIELDGRRVGPHRHGARARIS
ncbi:hypothetical protein NUW54_g10653 [Trametes sanguinea]|uniref:Uncharacterized protein n=1 Tax=Trametes sanguinea TaxID=158606 RepID=A0ACC1NXF6_9APHY|nr:hypothetical protein NUW54_g10653 [Trametes sanguinea]